MHTRHLLLLAAFAAPLGACQSSAPPPRPVVTAPAIPPAVRAAGAATDHAFDGTYRGALAITNERRSGSCSTRGNRDVTLRVQNGVATMIWPGRNFQNSVGADGSLSAAGGSQSNLTGRFDNGRFVGTITNTACDMGLDLPKV